MSVQPVAERIQNPEGTPKGAADKHAPKTIQVVEFILGKEHFAIDLFDVKEVVEYTTITKLPDSPEYVRGIIDLRGEITKIVDLKQRLNIQKTGDTAVEASRIMVLDTKVTGAKVAILVDGVTSVSTFEGNEVDYASADTHQDDSAIIGIIKRKVKEKEKEINELIIWIDIRELLRNTG